MPEVKTDSHQDTWSSEDHSDASSNLTHVESSGNSNLSSFLAIRSKVKRMVSDIKSPEDSNINDKAKLLQYMRMYKVEFEKNKMLSDNIIALQDHALNDKETIDKLQESITELKEQLRVGMAHVGVCSHGKCPDCEAQKIRESPQADEEAEEEIDLDEDSKEEKDEAEDSRNTPSDGNKIKKPRRKNNATPDFLKKKEAQINPGPIIIAKLKSKNFSKFKNFLPSKIILKQIQALYHERVTKTREFPNTREEEFSCFTYNFFLNNFGFKKLAEQKFIVFILSLKKYLHIIRINLFARFLGLLNGAGNYNLDEFNKYIEALDFLNSSTLGHHILNNESDPKHYTPFIRCLDYIKIFSENKLSQQEFLEFKKELEILKQPDLKRMNRLGIIDIDLFMTRVLLKYRLICNRTKKHVISAFRAADLDGNKYCSFKEFDTIYKYIEAEKYDKNFVSNLFYEHADSKVEEQNNLSFDKFTIVCVEYSLFTDAQQENFLGVKTPDNLLKMMDDIKFGWVMKSLALSENIYALKNISEEDREFWLQILKVLGEKITKSEVSYDDAKPLLIAYKMLLTEIETLKDQEAARDVYGIKIETHPDEFLQNSEINNDQDVEKSEVVPEEIEENVS